MSEIAKQSPVITHYPDAPVPTRFTRWNRQNPVLQFGKFVMACINIMMMVIKGHEK
ncbi:MAG: hypothetical protein GXX86_06985 [Propionibacterium sp.]|nr:hypothetical protein [Propionibacterium sp.]